jgi:lipopolysaccharide export system permease protein
MLRSKQYILKVFSKSFLTLFIPFYIIISLSNLIYISRLSSKISLSSSDFLTFYILITPDIIFITIPLTFLAASINTFAKLSESNEMIALFSLGIRPKEILKSLFPLATLFTTLLLIIAIFIIPYTSQTMNNFKNKKIYESNLKILPNSLSQDFGNHHVFIKENIEGNLKDVTMFTHQKNNNFQILYSQSGNIQNPPNKRSYLSLRDGTLYQTQKENLKIVNFKDMKLFNNAKLYSSKVLPFKDYWLRDRGKFYYYALLALTPLMLFVFYFSLGVYNSRYQMNLSSLYIILSIIIVYVLSIIAKKQTNVCVPISIIFFWIFLSLFTYNNRVANKY